MRSEKRKLCLQKSELGIFATGVAIYLVLLYFTRVRQTPEAMLLMLVFAPFSLLGLVADVLSGWVWGATIAALLSIVQGYLYVFVYRVIRYF